MAFLQVTSLSLAFGERTIFDGISFTLGPMSKAALVGLNGAGKSTLMKVLTGNLAADDGDIVLTTGAKLAYMAQSSQLNEDDTLFAAVESAYAAWFSLEQRASQLMQSADAAQLEEAADLHDRLAHSTFYQRTSLIDATLRGLGFKAEDFTKSVKHFSAGWQMRINLAKVLLSEAEILLLDEPSNFLDSETSLWLMDWLKRYSGGLLLVSHDRYFLDQVTTETLELFNGQLKRYAGSYSQYEKMRATELASLMKQRQQYQERLQQIDDFVRRFRASPTKASLVQSRVREAQKIMELLPDLPESSKEMRIRLPSPPHAGERVLYMEELQKAYGKRLIFSRLTLLIEKGERLAITGLNGAGKSTLMRILSGMERADTGYIKWGSGVEVGYFSEDSHAPFIGKTVLEEMEMQASLAMQGEVRNILGAFLFSGDSVYKTITMLSGGEKARLLLARLFLKPFNVLILDEPTNHLDLQSKELLLQALAAYTGTILFVSHDRHFNSELATAVLHMQEEPRFYPGNFTYYLEQWAAGSAGKLLQAPVVQDKSKTKVKAPAVSSVQQERLESKAQQARLRKLKRQEEELLALIATKEDELAQLQERLGHEDVYKHVQQLQAVQQQCSELEQSIEELYEAWQAVQEAMACEC